jgi:hypothetical protein
MAKKYTFDEALGLCIKYMHSFRATTRQFWDVDEEGVFEEVLKGCPKPQALTMQL